MTMSSPIREGDSDERKKASDDAEALEFYKSQIQQLEAELQDFQASSRELEQELEKELEASERSHRELRQKNEALKYEVEEWKTKYKQTKTESNTTQVQLQKEITALRESNRSTQLKLRDLEVSNDDFERQERIVKSSLEDVESKYNVAIERNAMNESEILTLEKEREELRIEVQRLRDELADLKVEAELSNERYLIAKSTTPGHQIINPRFMSPALSETPTTPTSLSPTPRPRVGLSQFSSPNTPTPPSPPHSETSNSSRMSTPQHDTTTTPRASHYSSKAKKLPSYAPKTPSYTNTTAAASHRRGTSNNPGSSIPIPPSRSLNQIRGLIGQMERLEKRVQSAKSKMPAPPQKTPPLRRQSPRNSASMNFLPTTVSVRSQRKRPSSTASSVSVMSGDHSTNVSRLSFNQAGLDALNGHTTSQSTSRPSSRASTSSRASLGGSGIPTPARPSSAASGRPSSRASMSGTTPRPSSRTSIGGMTNIPMPEFQKPRTTIGANDDMFATPQRRTTISRSNMTMQTPQTSTPGGNIPRRKSMQVMSSSTRRTSGMLGEETVSDGLMGPPTLMRKKKLSGVGEN